MYYNKRSFAVLAAGLAALGYASADSIVYPASLSTQTGTASNSGNSLSALQTKDQSDRQDTWGNYVEFYGSDNAYSGVFTFDVSGVDASQVSAYSLNVNYKGPRSDVQKWQFEYYNPSSNTWVAAGDNTDADKSWTWTPLSFCGQESFSKFVADGELKLRFSSDIKYDDCDIDYLSISTTVTDGSVPNTTESPATTVKPTETPATTVKPTTKPPSAPTTRPTSAPVTQKPTEKATSAPVTQKPTEKATSAPATQKPTQKATSAPATQKPTQKATSAPTQKATSAPTQKATSAPVTQKPSTGGRICPAGQVWVPQPGTTWQWQITGTVDTSKDVQMYDIDLFSASTSLIDTLHSKGRVVICYFSTQYEDWRPDASKFPSSVLGKNLDDWAGEKYVDIRSSVVRQIMTERLDMAVSKGCDGVEPDNVDGYSSTNGFSLTAANQLEYNKFLATEAHKRGLSIGLKNDLSQIPQLVSSFDWALNEQCNEYGECDDLKPFVTANKAVFGVDYKGSSSTICPKMQTAKFSWLMKNLDLDASGTFCATGSKAAYTCVNYNSKREVEENETASVIEDNLDLVSDNAEVQNEQQFDSSSSTIFSAAVAVFSFATAVGAMLL